MSVDIGHERESNTDEVEEQVGVKFTWFVEEQELIFGLNQDSFAWIMESSVEVHSNPQLLSIGQFSDDEQIRWWDDVTGSCTEDRGVDAGAPGTSIGVGDGFQHIGFDISWERNFSTWQLSTGIVDFDFAWWEIDDVAIFENDVVFGEWDRIIGENTQGDANDLSFLLIPLLGQGFR